VKAAALFKPPDQKSGRGPFGPRPAFFAASGGPDFCVAGVSFGAASAAKTPAASSAQINAPHAAASLLLCLRVRVLMARALMLSASLRREPAMGDRSRASGFMRRMERVKRKWRGRDVGRGIHREPGTGFFATQPRNRASTRIEGNLPRQT
jgi:hypothetical protein